jgi:hypothetical protein
MEGEMMRRETTQSLALMVVNPFEEVDPEKGIFDIKSPYDLPFVFAELLKYQKWLALFFLLQAIIALVIIYLQRTKKPLSQIFVKEKPKEPAHIVALRELDKIKKEKLWQSGQIKTFLFTVNRCPAPLPGRTLPFSSHGANLRRNHEQHQTHRTAQ